MVSAFPDIEIVKRDGKEQFLLLCCDGIWGVMSNDDAGAFVKNAIEGMYQGNVISRACERLLNECLKKGSRDNMSAVLVVNPTGNITPNEDELPPTYVVKEEPVHEIGKYLVGDTYTFHDSTNHISHVTGIIVGMNKTYDPKQRIYTTDIEYGKGTLSLGFTYKDASVARDKQLRISMWDEDKQSPQITVRIPGTMPDTMYMYRGKFECNPVWENVETSSCVYYDKQGNLTLKTLEGSLDADALNKQLHNIQPNNSSSRRRLVNKQWQTAIRKDQSWEWINIEKGQPMPTVTFQHTVESDLPSSK